MYEGKIERVQWLIGNGAILKRDINGHFPYQIASYSSVDTATHDNIIRLMIKAWQSGIIHSDEPTQYETRPRKHKHRFRRFFHNVTSTVTHVTVKPINKVCQVVEKPVQKALQPVTKPVAKVLAPVLQPVMKVVKPLNQVLGPVNAILKPAAMLCGGAGVVEVVVEVVKEQVIQQAVAPVNRIVNRVVNPVGSIVDDVLQPLAPIQALVQNAVGVANNGSKVINKLIPPTPLKQTVSQEVKTLDLKNAKQAEIKPVAAEKQTTSDKEKSQTYLYYKNVKKPEQATTQTSATVKMNPSAVEENPVIASTIIAKTTMPELIIPSNSAKLAQAQSGVNLAAVMNKSHEISTKAIMHELTQVTKAAVQEDHHDGMTHVIKETGEAISMLEKSFHIMHNHPPKFVGAVGKAAEVAAAIIEHPNDSLAQQIICNGTAEAIKITIVGALMAPVVIPAAAAGTPAGGPVGSAFVAGITAAALQEPLNQAAEPAAQLVRIGCGTLFEIAREIPDEKIEVMNKALLGATQHMIIH